MKKKLFIMVGIIASCTALNFCNPIINNNIKFPNEKDINVKKSAQSLIGSYLNDPNWNQENQFPYFELYMHYFVTHSEYNGGIDFSENHADLFGATWWNPKWFHDVWGGDWIFDDNTDALSTSDNLLLSQKELSQFIFLWNVLLPTAIYMISFNGIIPGYKLDKNGNAVPVTINFNSTLHQRLKDWFLKGFLAQEFVRVMNYNATDVTKPSSYTYWKITTKWGQYQVNNETFTKQVLQTLKDNFEYEIIHKTPSESIIAYVNSLEKFKTADGWLPIAYLVSHDKIIFYLDPEKLKTVNFYTVTMNFKNKYIDGALEYNFYTNKDEQKKFVNETYLSGKKTSTNGYYINMPSHKKERELFSQFMNDIKPGDLTITAYESDYSLTNSSWLYRMNKNATWTIFNYYSFEGSIRYNWASKLIIHDLFTCKVNFWWIEKGEHNQYIYHTTKNTYVNAPWTADVKNNWPGAFWALLGILASFAW